MMKNTNILLVFCLSMILMACVEHKKKEKAEPVSRNRAEETFIQEKTYNGLRIYTGKIPCEDCSGIEQRIVLKGDSLGIYRLTEVYKDATEDGDATIVSTGEWKLTGKGKQRQLYISQGHLGDSMRTARYEFADNKLYQTQLDGETIKSKYQYALRKVKKK